MGAPARASRTLFWDGDRGLAHCDGVHLELRSPPRVSSLALEQIDYAPRAGQRMVIERHSDWRALTPAEGAEIDALLLRMAQAARAVLC
jgi:hypothetical protein